MPASTPKSSARKSASAVAEPAKRKYKKKQVKTYARYVKKVMALEFASGKKGKGKRASRLGVTVKGMGIMNAFIVDLFERLAVEAGNASKFSGQKTLRSGALIAAVKMHFPTEMASHALSAGVAAVSHYSTALRKRKAKKDQEKRN